MDSKSDLRIKAKNIRKTLDIENISNRICSKIKKQDWYKKAQNIMIFYPLKYEINLLDLTKDKKNFFLPKVNGDELLVCPFNNDLKKSKFNIMEPCTTPIDPKNLDLIFVPALMTDKKGYRLGYGGGFYDKFLQKYQNIKTIVPIPKELIIEKLPNEKWDIKIDYTIET